MMAAARYIKTMAFKLGGKMNNRIRELALQANPASKEIYESDNWEYNCAAWCAQDLEKFAELIVRECADHIDDLVTCDDDGNQILDCDDVRTELLEHFGVEE